MEHPGLDCKGETLAGRSGMCYRMGVRVLFSEIPRLLAMALAVCLLGGCGWWHPHPHKVRSYDKAISEDERDPTYQEDPERADVEVRDVQ